MKLRTLIVEDEPIVAQTIQTLLSKYCSDQAEYVGSANSFQTAYDLIQQEKPDLVLLDIQINSAEGTGLGLLKLFPQRDFDVVFITGWSEYAVDAYKQAAIHYILKPIDLNELKEGINRAWQRRENGGQLAQASSEIELESNSLHISIADGFLIIPHRSIISLEASGSYTQIHATQTYWSKLVSIRIGELEAMLPHKLFSRVHKSHIINRKHIVSFSKKERSQVQLSDGRFVPVSRRQIPDFIRWVQE